MNGLIKKPLGLIKKEQWLGQLGAYVGQKYDKIAPKQTLPPIDTTNLKQTIWQEQGGQMFERLLGSKGVRVQRILTTFVSPEKIEQWQMAIYEQLAKWAWQWAKADLAKDERFGRLTALSDDERGALLHDVADKNRAWAVLGGMLAFFGLKGVVLDTAWLFLVSLKGIYQFLLIDGQAMSDDDKIALAYGLLNGLDLGKLQEKQVLMTALALGDMVLKNAQEAGLVETLKSVGETYQNRSYEKSLDELAKFINLDKLNPKWLHWCLPIGSCAMSAYYNVALTESLFGRVKATLDTSKVVALLAEPNNA